jgi:transglutaminase-like putative cysteine protease
LGREAGGKLRVRNAPGYPAPSQAVESRERRCSFVVDCDELSVRALVAELRAAHASVSADDVVAYVYRFIEHKHMARGFDIASVVAEKREGDCTEHAVLTAALLRGTGFPAHVVTGLAVLQIDGKWSAFGHAWTEYHDGQRWQLADATNVGEVVEKIRYLPLHVMTDEGPGYARASLDAFDVVDVRTLVLPTRLPP